MRNMHRASASIPAGLQRTAGPPAHRNVQRAGQQAAVFRCPDSAADSGPDDEKAERMATPPEYQGDGDS